MKITDLQHFQCKLEVPYRAHLTRLQNNECSSEADILYSKIQLAEYVLLTEEIKSHIRTRKDLTKVCESILAGTFDIDYNHGNTSLEDSADYTPIAEYLSWYLDDLKHFSPELAEFAAKVPRMDEILSEGLDKFFPGLKYGRRGANGEWQSMNDDEIANHRKETFTDNKQKAFKVLTHNEAIDKAKEILSSGATDLKRLAHILQHGSDLTLNVNPN
ncbi:MAG: hypothetical protein EOO43_02380 [Flavobacterium sp.]|nr:MAG: hypothetical protein EOO43_02380 [Flavobacterium sp.]